MCPSDAVCARHLCQKQLSTVLAASCSQGGQGRVEANRNVCGYLNTYAEPCLSLYMKNKKTTANRTQLG